MSYSKVEAETILQERIEEYNALVKEINSKIEKLEREKFVFLVKRDEAAIALDIVKQIRREETDVRQ